MNHCVYIKKQDFFDQKKKKEARFLLFKITYFIIILLLLFALLSLPKLGLKKENDAFGVKGKCGKMREIFFKNIYNK